MIALPPMPSELLLLAKDPLMGPALVTWGRAIQDAVATTVPVADEINRVWTKICHGNAQPTFEPALLVKRVKLIEGQLECAETNFRLTNQAYCKLDVETRELRGIGFVEKPK